MYIPIFFHFIIVHCNIIICVCMYNSHVVNILLCSLLYENTCILYVFNDIPQHYYHKNSNIMHSVIPIAILYIIIYYKCMGKDKGLNLHYPSCPHARPCM